MSDERRQFQRLTLHQPLDGWFGDYAVRLVDVSANGALIETDETIEDDAQALLRFFWRGREVEILAKTVRTDSNRSGLAFDAEDPALLAVLTESANEIITALEANARGDRESNVVGDETLTAAWRSQATGFVMWMLEPRGWVARAVLAATQPDNGFTIPASEAEDQVALLRRTYETGDAEARRMTRMFAELSAAGDSVSS